MREPATYLVGLAILAGRDLAGEGFPTINTRRLQRVGGVFRSGCHWWRCTAPAVAQNLQLAGSWWPGAPAAPPEQNEETFPAATDDFDAGLWS
jgi:hypothetical protein